MLTCTLLYHTSIELFLRPPLPKLLCRHDPRQDWNNYIPVPHAHAVVLKYPPYNSTERTAFDGRAYTHMGSR